MKKLLFLLLALISYHITEAQVHTFYQHKEVNTIKNTTTKCDRLRTLHLVITYDYCYKCDEYGNRINPSPYNFDIIHRLRTDENGNTIYRGGAPTTVLIVSSDKTRLNEYADYPNLRHLIRVYDKEKPKFDDIIMY